VLGAEDEQEVQLWTAEVLVLTVQVQRYGGAEMKIVDNRNFKVHLMGSLGRWVSPTKIAPQA
jgi:hypothetical protein